MSKNKCLTWCQLQCTDEELRSDLLIKRIHQYRKWQKITAQLGMGHVIEWTCYSPNLWHPSLSQTHASQWCDGDRVNMEITGTQANGTIEYRVTGISDSLCPHTSRWLNTYLSKSCLLDTTNFSSLFVICIHACFTAACELTVVVIVR